MVSFTCDVCQDVVKKPKIDRHCAVNCPNAWIFTCIDCNKAFEGFQYVQHNQCVTEEEKYCSGDKTGILSKKRKAESSLEVEVEQTQDSKRTREDPPIIKWGGTWLKTVTRIANKKKDTPMNEAIDLAVKSYLVAHAEDAEIPSHRKLVKRCRRELDDDR